LVNTPAQVTSFGRGLDGEQWPLTFISKGGRYRATLTAKQAEHFVMVAKWWTAPMPGGQAPEAHMYRLPLIPSGMVEVVKEPDGTGRLWKAYD
jgi:hypothetical protein